MILFQALCKQVKTISQQREEIKETYNTEKKEYKDKIKELENRSD